MRILVLGKSGMLGQELMKVFTHDDVIGFDRSELDITDQEEVFEKFMTIAPDVVINATGFTQVDLAEEEEEIAELVNGYAVGILAKASRETGATFVHFSTDYVFGGDKENGYDETDALQPLNAYGRSKALGEQLLVEEMELLRDEKDQEGFYFLIRTSWLWGKHGKNFVDTMLALGQQKKELKVVNDQHGKPTFAADLAQQVKWLVNSREYPSGIYHITNEGATTWYDFAKEIFRQAGLKVKVTPCSSDEYPRPAVRPQWSVLKNNLLPPLRSWKEALAEYLASS